MNPFQTGDSFYWVKSPDKVLTVDKVESMFVITKEGGAYLYTKCVKLEGKI